MPFISVPVVSCLLSAGKPDFSDYYEILRYRKIPQPLRHRPGDQYYLMKINGDSLRDEGILSGHWIVYRVSRSANAGQLCVLATPHGETVKFFWPQPDGTVVLRSANPDFPDQVWEQADIQIRGIVVQSGRDW